MVLYRRLLQEIRDFEYRAGKENVTPADYAVEVKGIPEDAKDEVRITHSLLEESRCDLEFGKPTACFLKRRVHRQH